MLLGGVWWSPAGRPGNRTVAAWRTGPYCSQSVATDPAGISKQSQRKAICLPVGRPKRCSCTELGYKFLFKGSKHIQ
jgi:hypothetical protein